MADCSCRVAWYRILAEIKICTDGDRIGNPYLLDNYVQQFNAPAPPKPFVTDKVYAVRLIANMLDRIMENAMHVA